VLGVWTGLSRIFESEKAKPRPKNRRIGPTLNFREFIVRPQYVLGPSFFLWELVQIMN